jgi:hypothetical protein
MVENFLAVLRDHTAGDPMRADVKWTNLSRRKISRELAKRGTPAGKDVVSALLWEHGYRRRKANKKKTMGQHADRDAQFQRIAELKNEFANAGQPIISIDTKKKELLGNFQRPGVTDGEQPLIVNDHDFVSQGNGTLIPHGIYDVAKNHGSLHLNTSHDTTQLCCDSLRLWWREQGQADYPSATRLLILCDGGGSNSASKHIFKEDLQQLANDLGIEIRVAHYPPYCSKYNPIEHRLFPHVTRACLGVPLESAETARYYMSKTETTTGLTTTVRLLETAYETGRKYAANFVKTMTIAFDQLLPKWNYTAKPSTLPSSQ